MKIGILTQPLHVNYGGLLQAFALQRVLKNCGHDVWTIDIPFRRSGYRDSTNAIKRVMREYLFRERSETNTLQPSQLERKVITRHTDEFIRNNIRTTERISTVEKIKALKKYGFDAYIVGSDQVWRPKYSPGIPTFFLDFLGGKKSAKRIAYAASFGVDYLEYTKGLTKKCKILAQQFDAISVREDSGVALCREHFGVSATHALDPTMLLERKNYIDLIGRGNAGVVEQSLMCYVLGWPKDKILHIAEAIGRQLNLKINSVLPKKYSIETRENIEECVFPPPEVWLRGFMDASFVVTNSFHGTVFSIIFNKPFIAVEDKSRGSTRISSLLTLFGLENRLVSTDAIPEELISKSVDYGKANMTMKRQQEKSLSFLREALEK